LTVSINSWTLSDSKPLEKCVTRTEFPLRYA
jgi:hypothetical protein